MEPRSAFETYETAPGGNSLPPPWGYVMTVVWGLLAFGISAIAAIVFCSWLLGLEQLRAIMAAPNDDLNVKFDGVFLSYVYFMSAIVQVLILVLAVKIKRWPIAAYLALTVPSARVLIFGVLLIGVLVAISDGAIAYFGKNPVSEFQIVAYRTAKAAGGLPLLLAVIVVLAPIAEEILFRGFAYRGFVRRPSHAPYAILVISLIFAAGHQQYDLLGLTQVFVMGLLFGIMRWLSGSTILTILMHVTANLIAMVETMVYVEWLTPAATIAN
jgi:hypothetical protein